MLSKILQLIGLGCDIYGGYILAKNLLRLSPQDLDDIGTWDWFEDFQKRTIEDRKTAKIGFGWLAAGFVLQALSTVISFWE
jgi:hypothetical protein